MPARFAAISAALLALTAVAPPATAQTAPSTVAAASPSGTILLTIFLKHDQSKSLGEIKEDLKRNGYYQRFPPQGVEMSTIGRKTNIGRKTTIDCRGRA